MPTTKSEKAKTQVLAFWRLRNLLKLAAFTAFDFRSEIVGNLLHLSSAPAAGRPTVNETVFHRGMSIIYF
jgi:hypothetical protein